jgi:hypothetical protein
MLLYNHKRKGDLKISKKIKKVLTNQGKDAIMNTEIKERG